MHGETDHCKHGLIAAHCGLCVGWNENNRVNRAVNRLVDRLEKLGGNMEAQS